MLLRQQTLLLCVVCLAVPSAVYSQSTPRAAADGAGRAAVPNPQAKPLPPALEQVLERWANASSKIERLEGEHVRRVYDSVFEVERLSEGQFWYKSPDNGRIDVTPSEITKEMLNARDEPGAAVRRKKATGEPYELVPGKPEKWVCDGVRVYEVDEEKQSAQVAQLPPNMQGVSIMDSPLPFLFGMPPEKAKERFHLSFSRPFDPRSGVAYITALPRKEQDANSWSQADVILDLRTYLPLAIQLKDPPGTGVTVYRFNDLQVNKPVWLKKPTNWFVDLFEPDLRGYAVIMIDAAAAQRVQPPADRIAQGPAGGQARVMPPVVPDFSGVPYQDALNSLQQMGLTKDNKKVLIFKGAVAAREQDIYKVQAQLPAAGTPITADTVVELKLWTK